MNNSSTKYKRKLILITLLVELAVISSIFIFSAISLQTYIEKDLQRTLLSTAQYASFNINANDIIKVRHTNDIYFSKIKNQLLVIEGIYKLQDGLAYIVELKAGKPVFSVMTNEVSFRGHLYPEEIAERIHAVYRGEDVVADYYKDRNGTFISVIVPLHDESKVIAALEIDFPGEKYQQLLYSRIVPFLIILFVLLVFSFSIVFAILVKLYNVREEKFKQTQLQVIQSEKMLFLSRLVAGISHEANTPISTIKSTSDMLTRAIEKIVTIVESSKSLDDVINNVSFTKSVKIFKDTNILIFQASERLGKMVNRLKKFSRLDEAEYQKTDINESIETTLNLLQSEFSDKITVEKQLGIIPEIYAFPVQLNQMFMSLLENATQAISVRGTIKITTSPGKEDIKIELEDTGIGIPPDKLENLFRINFTTRDSHIRMGMGLLNAYNIVQKHHGSIKVTSEVGRGTKFVITLPTPEE